MNSTTPQNELPVTESEGGPIVGLSGYELKRRRLAGDPDRPAHIQIGRRISYMPSELARWRDSHVIHPTTEPEQPRTATTAD